MRGPAINRRNLTLGKLRRKSALGAGWATAITNAGAPAFAIPAVQRRGPAHAASTSALIFAPSRFSAIARSYWLCKFSQNAAPEPR